jgi:Fe2+ or Zn2+ uptake regulation protein
MQIALAMSEPHPADPVVLALLAYLARNPQAADSLAGVARWWVGDDDTVSIERVRDALDHLVAIGALRRAQLADGTEWYAGTSAPNTHPTPTKPPGPQRLH